MFRMFLLSFLLTPLSQAAPSQLTIDDVIRKSQDEAEIAQAARKNIQSIEFDIRARDIVLGWQFNGEYSSVNDDRDQVAFVRRIKYDTFTYNLTKPFSTGTTLLLTGSHEDVIFDTIGPRNSEAWEVRLTQSLWRDAFGHATDLRHRGERAELVSRKAQAYFDLQNFLVTMEGLYWDLSLAVREHEIRQRNIENGQRLEVWTRRRVAQSAAERADLLQAQALVSQATLDAINAENQIENLKNRLRQYLPQVSTLEPSLESLEKPRPVQKLMVNDGSSEPRRLDTISASYLADQAEAEAKRVRDGYRPRVDAYVAYGQNGIATDFDAAWRRATDSDFSISRVGVVLSIDLSRGLVADRVKAAQLAAEARILQAQTQNRLSKISWEDLLRQIQILQRRADEASKLSELQNRKVIEERRRFQLGRSTVFQMVTFELDAASSELNKFRALTELRKAESQARLFTTIDLGAT